MNQKLLQHVTSIAQRIVKLVTYSPCRDRLKITATGVAQYFQMAAVHGKKNKKQKKKIFSLSTKNLLFDYFPPDLNVNTHQ